MAFQQPSFWVIAFIVIVVAIALDLLLLGAARRYWQSRRSSPTSATTGRPVATDGQKVYFLGSFSPVLTLLRYGRLPRPAPLAAETTAASSSAPGAPASPVGRRPWRPLAGLNLRLRDWPGQLRSRLRRSLQPANLRRIWSSVLRHPGEAGPTLGAIVSGRSLVSEWSLLAVVVLVYCTGFLQFGPDVALTGNEAEVFQVNSWLLQHGVQSGAFPLWNPYIRSGIPYVSDPMLHIFNPLTSLPVLLLGVLNGYRVALFLSFLAAAWGMWYLGRTLGLAAPARLWVAIMYAFAGQPVAKFLQGQYLFVFGFAWIPWAIAGLLLALHTRLRRHVALAAAALALIFLSGNVYYAFYMLIIGAVLSPVLVVVRRPRIHVDWRRVQVLTIIGGLALTLIAVQLLPLAEFWPRLTKATNLSRISSAASPACSPTPW